MERFFQKGYAKMAVNEPTGKRVRYLPHFGVQNINKPGKVRIVYDSAAESRGKSFNSFLLAGPDLLKSLLGVLMRFRQFAYAIKADIRDMFLKIKISKEDQDAQRFLWRGANRTGEPKECIFTSVLFGAKSSPCTAIYIKNKNASQYLSRFPATANSLIENCYMDDFLDSCETITEAAERVEQAITINEFANWEMHGWASNAPEVLENRKIDDNAGTLVKEDVNKLNNEKILGLKWANSSDELMFNFNQKKITDDFYSGQKRPTKREFLGVIMSVFDPLGFLTPFTIQSRILMQNIWSSGIGWDEALRDEEFEHWRQWLHDLEKVKICSIPRCYQNYDYQVREAELHVFCDASTKAYAAVAYWRFILNNDSFHVAIIMAKSRVAPLKPSTIPRLELQAALVATRLARTIEKEHDFKIKRRVFWSDSQTVLHWISKDPREFRVFVANRLDEIRENSEIKEWRWVPTKDNPADDGTRAAPNALDKGSRWLTGPPFLREIESSWPSNKDKFNGNPEDLEYVKTLRSVMSIEGELAIIDFSRFSSLNRLLFVVSRVLEAIDIWRNRKHTLIERRVNAEKICYKLSQSISFAEEINCIKKSKSIPKSSKIAPLGAFLDMDHVLRAEGRLKNFIGQDFETQPIILDAREDFARLLIKDYHERFYHGNHESVINEIRQRFWIVGLRQALKGLAARCIICTIRRGLPAKPKMADLPPGRLAGFLRPFSHCSLDYFGPMQVKIGRT
ncbi:uncharacterized protein LOC108630075 [Ceratina calcarata]|uniref:Uncharacterized protein LOC108630075 n=1 Tax=Ceratina calcarata TaxID=156304 RepID=A0AAJ7JA93_9HYME|nr:uncharacterized protein LOC108630075 [Ceratina calcarata]